MRMLLFVNQSHFIPENISTPPPPVSTSRDGLQMYQHPTLAGDDTPMPRSRLVKLTYLSRPFTYRVQDEWYVLRAYVANWYTVNHQIEAMP